MKPVARLTPARAGVLLATGLALVAWTVAGPQARAAASLEAKFEQALAAGRIPEAAQAADSLIARLGRQSPLHPLDEALLADSLGLRLFGVGSPAAFDAASPLFERALELREQGLGPQDTLVAGSLGTLAALRDYQGRWPEALDLSRRALQIRLHHFGSGDPRVAMNRRQVGTFLYYLGRYDEAEPELTAAIAVFSRADARDPSTLADLWNAVAEIQRARGDLERAESSFLNGLGVARAELSPQDPILPYLSNNLAGLYKDMERYDQAELLLLESLRLGESANPDSAVLAAGYLNLAEVYRLQGRTEEAEPRYDQALVMARRALGKENPDLATYLNQSAALQRQLGHYRRAEALYAEAQALLSRTLGKEHPSYAQTLDDLSALREARGDYAGALRIGQQALEIRRTLLGAEHPDVALTYVSLARQAKAARGFGDAQANRWIERAVAILDSTRAYPEARAEAHAARARWKASSGDLGAAMTDLDVALREVDTLRTRRGGGDLARVSILARQSGLFDLMIGWKLASGDIAGAYETHERARSRLLLDQIAASGVNLRAGISPSILDPLEERERAGRRRLAEAQRALDEVLASSSLSSRERARRGARLRAQRDSGAADYGRALALIKEHSPVWRRVLSDEGRVASLDQVRGALVGSDAVLLEYHVGRDSSYLFLVPPEPETPAVYRLELGRRSASRLGSREGPLDAETLDRLLSGPTTAALATNALGATERGIGGIKEGSKVLPTDPAVLEERLQALRAALVPETAWKRIRSARVAIVIVDGALHMLPFEALVITPASGGRGTRYWLDDGPALAYGSSATSLLRIATRPSPPTRAAGHAEILSVSDPSFRSPRAGGAGKTAPPATMWERLPGTALETQRIRRAFPPGSVEVLQGAQATERRVRDAVAGRRFLHFATHGFVTETHGELLAGLVLGAPQDTAPPSTDDGLLQLFEIYELPLRCEVAVLSACETHRGPRVEGEGVFALSRGFLAAGAQRVVATLWSIPDAPTAELIGSFFDSLAGAPVGAPLQYAVALRDAKRSIRAQERWAHPLNWAAPVLSGPP
jgi:CHAT domain-containing protein/tetratricopeptide (TPR) repeat protein